MYHPVEDIPETLEVAEGIDECGAAYHAIIVPLAESDDGFRKVSAEISLHPFTNEGSLFHEFQFTIVVTDDADGTVFRTCIPDMARGYIPASIRSSVMSWVCHAAAVLVEAIQPRLIYRATKATHPPDKALHKHQMITDTLVGVGYTVVESGTNDCGQEFWTLQR